LPRQDRRELTSRLRQVPLFSMLHPRALRTVAASAAERDIRAGEVLVAEGATDRDLFVILRGEAVAMRGGATVVTLGVGDFFGEFALIAGEPRTATITASTDMRVMVLSASGMDEAIRREQVLARRMWESRERRLRMLRRVVESEEGVPL
jgi:CRP/FNR family transcriptional regulator, cyclic AMP receptor protein